MFKAVVLLRKPGSCDPVSVVIGPDQPSSVFDPWAPPASILFERLTALGIRALGYFQERAALTQLENPGEGSAEHTTYGR